MLFDCPLGLRQVDVHALLAGGHVAAKAETLPRLLLLETIETVVHRACAGRQPVDFLFELIQGLGVPARSSIGRGPSLQCPRPVAACCGSTR